MDTKEGKNLLGQNISVSTSNFFAGLVAVLALASNISCEFLTLIEGHSVETASVSIVMSVCILG
ncbi:hypothetical protein [Candidatus Regiella endosymbiont of Tuberolachnus salignus]|uniref:hypothetical protein n=1 Tax=Candidatus Regiella endosymbiont of Tuberolachnus salignus TaxID=3077956 RepID=UPI0030CDA990